MNITTKLSLLVWLLMEAHMHLFDCRQFRRFRVGVDIYDVTCCTARLRLLLIENARRHARRAVAFALKALAILAT